ncbi:MAG TPA: OsmC family protein [Longimicrobium sp.]|nr:OsmC family protein [Longimicrobium sp.]
MRISARVENGKGRHHVTLTTNGQSHALSIAPKAEGRGSSANGGELLALALATCYCNDVYREAAARGIAVRGVRVEVDTEFGAAGEPARRIRYRATVDADAPEDAVRALIEHTDRVAEVHNTLRAGIAVELERANA